MVEEQDLEMRRWESLGLGDAGPCKLAIMLLIFTLSTVKEGFGERQNQTYWEK